MLYRFCSYQVKGMNRIPVLQKILQTLVYPTLSYHIKTICKNGEETLRPRSAQKTRRKHSQLSSLLFSSAETVKSNVYKWLLVGRWGQYIADSLGGLTPHQFLQTLQLLSSGPLLPLCVLTPLPTTHHPSHDSWDGQHQENSRKRATVYCVFPGSYSSSLRLRNWPKLGNHAETRQVPQRGNRKPK